MPTRNINLTERLDRFVDAGVASGRYGNASEMIREGLRLLEQWEEEKKAKLEWLRAAVRQSIKEIDCGKGITFDSMDNLDAYIDQLGEEAFSELAAERKRDEK